MGKSSKIEQNDDNWQQTDNYYFHGHESWMDSFQYRPAKAKYIPVMFNIFPPSFLSFIFHKHERRDVKRRMRERAEAELSNKMSKLSVKLRDHKAKKSIFYKFLLSLTSELNAWLIRGD